MITREQAIVAAKELFPDEVHDGSDCKNEAGRVGLPCRICEENFGNWNDRIEAVQKAIEKALATP